MYYLFLCSLFFKLSTLLASRFCIKNRKRGRGRNKKIVDKNMSQLNRITNVKIKISVPIICIAEASKSVVRVKCESLVIRAALVVEKRNKGLVKRDIKSLES